MSQIRNGVLLIIVIVFLVVAHFHLRKTSTTYNYIFSPSDLYHHLSNTNFDLSETGLSKTLEITHKYPGNHRVSIIVEKPVEPGILYDSKFIVKISISNGENILFERTVSDSSAWFYGGKDNSGFTLMDYKIQNELLLGAPLSAQITVIEGNSKFASQYGNQRIVINKIPDE
ncbi:MAG: hypothetical protein OEY89_16640 [Gammaproteobacteria bacterium]|nr:hypothetical protein [Gammaproteobacteria bacterium]